MIVNRQFRGRTAAGREPRHRLVKVEPRNPSTGALRVSNAYPVIPPAGRETGLRDYPPSSACGGLRRTGMGRRVPVGKKPLMKWLAAAAAVLAGSVASSCPSSEFQVRVAHLRAQQLYPWSEISFVGDRGTVDDPIIIAGARSNAIGVLAEREWLDERWWRYRVREQRLLPQGDRFLDVLEVEVLTESPGMTTVVFDVTGFYGGGPDLGAWRFVDWLGRTTAGTIESSVASWDVIDESWHKGVQSQTGFLVYQVDDGINDGLIAAGPIVSGMRDGEWQMLQERTGLTVTCLTNGIRNGTERMWDAAGELRCEIDWREGHVVETRIRTASGEMAVKDAGPIP